MENLYRATAMLRKGLHVSLNLRHVVPRVSVRLPLRGRWWRFFCGCGGGWLSFSFSFSFRLRRQLWFRLRCWEYSGGLASMSLPGEDRLWLLGFTRLSRHFIVHVSGGIRILYWRREQLRFFGHVVRLTWEIRSLRFGVSRRWCASQAQQRKTERENHVLPCWIPLRLWS